MVLVRVPVVRPFVHYGKPQVIGDVLEVTPLMAAILRRRGVVSLTKTATYQTTALHVEPAAAPDARPRSRREYRRKDMTAAPMA